MATTLDALEQRVAKLEKTPRGTQLDKETRDRLEDLFDFVYGKNVRPQLTERGEDDYPARVKPNNEDDSEEG